MWHDVLHRLSYNPGADQECTVPGCSNQETQPEAAPTSQSDIPSYVDQLHLC